MHSFALDEPAEMTAQARGCRRLMRNAAGQMRETLRLLTADYGRRRHAAENAAGEVSIIPATPGFGRTRRLPRYFQSGPNPSIGVRWTCLRRATFSGAWLTLFRCLANYRIFNSKIGRDRWSD
jgi:hypothetical protein